MLAALACLALGAFAQDAESGPFQANGVKVGEVDQDSALVWVRATRRPERNAAGPEFDASRPRTVAQLPEDVPLDAMRDAVPGARAAVRVRWGASGGDERASPWVEVGPETDYAHVFRLEELSPATRYTVISEARAIDSEAIGSTVTAGLRTAPTAEEAAALTFVVSTCQDFPRRDDPELGHRIYNAMLGLQPDFFAHLGDILYYDKAGPFATTVPLARHKWNRMFALANQREFHRFVPSYFVKDDHDLLRDDCWPELTFGELTFEDGLRLHREQLPVPRAGEPSYRTVRWGRDLQVWFLEGREHRSRNRMADGPRKTILGEEQSAWLERTLRASDATHKVVLSATPLVGPDRATKNDNHANAGFAYEGYHLRKLMAEVGAVVVCGDRHWQYASRDAVSGLLEFGCGPATDSHAGGYPKKPEFEPEFVRVRGGFLSVRVDGDALSVAHHDVEGSVVHEVSLQAEAR